MMRKSPGFTAVAVLTLALGIGANTAIFSVVNALLLRSLPLPQPDRLFFISGSNPFRGGSGGPFSLIAYEGLRDHAGSFTGITAFTPEGLTLTGMGDPEQLSGALVSPNFLDVLQVRPAVGRGFQKDEGDAGANPVVVISQRLWRRRFASDPRIIGRSITLSQEVHTVIGVMPPEFPFPFTDVDLWTTRLMSYSGLQPEQIRNGAGYLTAIGRLRPGVTAGQAEAEVAVLNRQYRHEHPGNPDADPQGRLDVVPLQESLVTDIRPVLLILIGAVGIVLLIACANVAGLMLARATARTREIVVRAALGAGRGSLIRHLLAESMLLAAAGGVLGVLFALWGVSLLVRASDGTLPAFQPVRVDLPVLGFTLVVSLLTGVLFGLVPAVQVSQPDLNGVLRDGAWGTTSGAGRHRLRSFVVAGQMALSVVLLIGASLLVQSFRRLHSVNPGFEPLHAMTMRVSLPPAAYPDDARRSKLMREVTGRLRTLPGVTSAAASLGLPLAPGVIAPFLAEGQPAVPVGQRPLAAWNAVSPGYFKTLEIPLIRGRDFSDFDDTGAPRRVIISQSLARRFWPNDDPIGKHIAYARRQIVAEIVGVAGDVKSQALESAAGMVFYTPYPQFAWPGMSLTFRTTGDPRALLNAARAQVYAVDKDLPVINPQTLDEMVDHVLSQRRQLMYLVTGFAAVAMLLAAVGLYGVLAYSVAQRTTEIGIRQAVGARRADVLRLVLVQGLQLSLAGVAIGALAASVLTRLISQMLYQVSATDPLTFAGISLLFLLIALAASFFPAWRATRVDPLEALRGR